MTRLERYACFVTTTGYRLFIIDRPQVLGTPNHLSLCRCLFAWRSGSLFGQLPGGERFLGGFRTHLYPTIRRGNLPSLPCRGQLPQALEAASLLLPPVSGV